MTTANAKLLFLLIVAVVGCADHRAATHVDPWWHPSAQLPDHTTLWAIPWTEVKPAATAAAERQLSTAEAIQIDAQLTYTEQPIPVAPGEACYLVRALYLIRETGGFNVHFDGRDLYIHHSCLGGHPVPMKPQPLLVALPKPPEHVYVTVGMAQ